MKKQEIILKNNTYRIWNIANNNLYIFANFLTNDVGCAFGQTYKTWALNNNELEIGGNRSDLEKHNSTIYIQDKFKRTDANINISFKISKENFISILDHWIQLQKEKPQKITIIQNNDQITLEPSSIIEPSNITTNPKPAFDIKKINPEQLKNIAQILPNINNKKDN